MILPARSTRRSVVAGLGLTTLAISARAASPLDQVLSRHTAARGGAAALDRVRNMSADLEISEQGATLVAHYRASLAGRMRIDVLLDGKRVFSEGLDDQGAWGWPGGQPGPTASSADGEKALRHGIAFNLLGLHAYPKHGHRLSLLGDETIAGTPYAVIQIDMADGFQTFRYIDRRTWLIGRGRDVRALHPDADPTKKLLENVFTDYRPVDGVQVSFASHQVDVVTGAVLQRTKLIAQRHNLPEAELAFARG